MNWVLSQHCRLSFFRCFKMIRQRTANVYGFGDNAFKSASQALYLYRDIRIAIAERKAEKKANKGNFGIRSSGPGDPTYKEAAINLEEEKPINVKGKAIENPVEWLKALDEVFSGLSKEDMNLIEATYWTDKSFWEILEDLSLSRNAYYSRKNKILAIVAINAAAHGLIKLQ